MFWNSTQKHDVPSVTEAELYAAVSIAQDMLYVMHVVLPLGLLVELPLILESDNMGTVYLANTCGVPGRTRHIDVIDISTKLGNTKNNIIRIRINIGLLLREVL